MNMRGLSIVAPVIALFAGCYEPPTFNTNSNASSGSPPQFIPGNGAGDGDGDGVGDGDGDGDGQASPTCKQPCDFTSECTGSEVCTDTSEGRICLSYLCQDCFDVGATCFSDNSTCEFIECGDPDPNYSDTCQDPCDQGNPQCDPGESCLYSANGWICLPPSCQGCWDSGYSCTYNTFTCDFTDCT